MEALKPGDTVVHTTEAFADWATVLAIDVDAYGSRLVFVCLQGRYGGRVTRTYYESNLTRSSHG